MSNGSSLGYTGALRPRGTTGRQSTTRQNDNKNISDTLQILRNLVNKNEKLIDSELFIELYNKLKPREKHDLIKSYDQQTTANNKALLYRACIYKAEGNNPLYLADLKQAAAAGNTTAMYNLALNYQNGILVKKDLNIAKAIFNQIINCGDPNGWCGLGLMHLEGIGVKKNEELAIEMFWKAFNSGSTIACLALGKCYVNGSGITQDYATGLKYYWKAADAGESAALYEIAIHYMDGRGVTKNLPHALDLLQQAAKLGNMHAKYILAKCYHKGEGCDVKITLALKEYQTAASLGCKEAMRDLANFYLNSDGGHQDINTAIYWFKKAAEFDDLPSIKALAKIYLSGQYVKQNIKLGLYWHSLAAKLGDTESMRILGKHYLLGIDVAANTNEALDWYRDAILKHVDFKAINELITLYANNVNAAWVQEDIAKYQQAADAGNAAAMVVLAYCHQQQLGVRQDSQLAYYYFLNAAHKFNQAQADTHLNNLFSNLTSEIRAEIITESFTTPFSQLSEKEQNNFPEDPIALNKHNASDLVVRLFSKQTKMVNCVLNVETLLKALASSHTTNPLSREKLLFKINH